VRLPRFRIEKISDSILAAYHPKIPLQSTLLPQTIAALPWGSAMVLLAAMLLAAADEPLWQLPVRRATEVAPNTGRYHPLHRSESWEPTRTAVVICDLWDKHWCPGATARVGEMVPRIEELTSELRKRGALIVHCPSDTMDYYKGHPGRKLAMAAPKVEPKIPLQRWCKLDPAKEGKLPIDDSDGGCAENAPQGKAWTRQHPGITIAPGDAITESEEAYYLFRQRNIKNVLVLGVHTNMCVLGRPFGIRQLTAQGLNVVLVRDLTDTMYNPAKAPFVSHFTGTDLVVEHIERHWCTSALSSAFVRGDEFRFKDDQRKTVLVIAAEDEYKTELSLPTFALKHLGTDFRVRYLFADAKERHVLPGLEDELKRADGVLLSVRRRPLIERQLTFMKDFILSGKPVIAIRTSSHAFAPKAKEKLPAGVAQWPEFDREILGGNYTGHYPKLATAVARTAVQHEILNGVQPFTSDSWLYKAGPVTTDCTVLLTGTVGANPTEPAAWLRTRPNGGRVFYTSLGHENDFADVNFQRLLKNAVAWAMK
jgi:nicotinamidase-related amidase